MYRIYTIIFLIGTFLFTGQSFAQKFNGVWKTDYSTYDNSANGTGDNTIGVGVIHENTFVALVMTRNGLNNYLVGYSNADSAKGKMGNIPYIPGYIRSWEYGFASVPLNYALDLVATPDSLIYVADNDPARNILVFKLGTDSVDSAPYRLETNADSLWAIDIDKNGRIYVTVNKDSTHAGEVWIYKGIKEAPDDWETNFTGQPIFKITLPEPGSYRGIAVNGDGTVIYVSNFKTGKIYCYTGNPSTGYSLYNGFHFTLKDTLFASSGDTLIPGPIGIKLMPDKNILFVASHFNFLRGVRYQYGRIYALNPNTGDILDTIDAAKWNFDVTGGYDKRPGGTVGTASGYTSPYNVAFDEKYNLYDQSYFGWAVDKWTFTGTIPTVPITIVTAVKKEDNNIPVSFKLSQNYPNPFNPSTTIDFSLRKASNIILSVYDINGKLVTKLINGAHFSTGNYSITFDASKLASGIYIYVLKTNTQQLSKKMTLVK